MVTFDLFRFRFHFRALDPVSFPPGKSGNTLRGTFGNLFRQIACKPDCPGARDCPHRQECPYARIFEPRATGAGPSGLADWPRPFVFRAAHLDGQRIPPCAEFQFDLHVFYPDDPALECFVQTFKRLASEGLGPGRGRAQLTAVDQEKVSVDLAPETREISHITVRFLTPTELKGGPRPEFRLLFARSRDRVSTLRALYGPGPLQIDFREMGERASSVEMTRCDLAWSGVERRSSRTGQVHPIGGFTGEAEYEGALAEFIPYLRAAAWTGIGRQTVWGKGVIEVG